jgi:hypothetical protein
MQPVVSWDGALQPHPTQKVLCDESHEDRVLGVMIEGIAAGKALNDQAARFVERRGDIGLLSAERPQKDS